MENALWLAHYRETGLDRTTGAVPKGDWLTWAREQVQKQDDHRASLTDLVKQKKGSK